MLDAQAIPYRDGCFDAVIANHMLYHVPDRPRAIRELHRVLRPGGRLFAATNGADHLREIAALLRRFLPQVDSGLGSEEDRFGLVSGVPQLRACFPEVRAERYDDALVVTESEPVLDFMRSTAARAALTPPVLQAMRAVIEREIAAQGAFRVAKESGVLIAAKPSDSDSAPR